LIWELEPIKDIEDYPYIQDFVDYTISITNKTLVSKGITFKVRWQT
jgi:hypothetical protein